VTEPEGSAAAVLIRALEPTEGVELMRERRGREEIDQLCSGPGKLTEALGVGLSLNGADLLAPPFELSPRPESWNGTEIVAATRIGITKAAELPWRYCAAGSRYVSRPHPSDHQPSPLEAAS
jgi:DNA-3-methyladenine glycosylase